MSVDDVQRRLQRVTQFCLLVSAERAFPGGDTVVTARVKDVSGNPGTRARLVVRVDAAPAATFTPTLGPGPSPTPSTPAIGALPPVPREHSLTTTVEDGPMRRPMTLAAAALFTSAAGSAAALLAANSANR